MAAEWAKKVGIPKITAVKAEWDKYGKSAGYKRNVAMADLEPDCIVAFSGGAGTMMMIGIGLKRGIEVIRDHEIL